jgi:hypothetical protein
MNMRVVQKTLEKIVLEVTSKEIDDEGFDAIWDKVRKVYSTENYDIYAIRVSEKNEDIIFIELVNKKIKD